MGTLGIEQAFAPLCPPLHSFALVCTGAVLKKAVVENDQIVIKPVMNIVFTADHRYGDAAVGMKLMRLMKDYIENPEGFRLEKYETAVPYESYSKKKN